MKMTFIVADDATHQLSLVQWTRSPKYKHKQVDVEDEWIKAQRHWAINDIVGLSNKARITDKHLVGAIKGHHTWIDHKSE
mgnify:FL=1|tara:strand:+ start:426 stop:665 length:240 start_codon:yes stop_codon:yes gene_type:complete